MSGSSVDASEVFVNVWVQGVKSFDVGVFERKKKFVEIFHHFILRREYLSSRESTRVDESRRESSSRVGEKNLCKIFKKNSLKI